MKIVTSLLLSLSLVMSGCGTLGKPDPAVVQTIAAGVGLLGGQAALAYNPSFRAELELTREALKGFVAAGTGNATNLQAIIQQHLPTGLGATNSGSLVVSDAGIVLYDAAGALIAKIDKAQLVSTYAQPIAVGLLQGLSQALGDPTTMRKDKKPWEYTSDAVLRY